MEEIFNKLNEKLFGGNLPKIVIKKSNMVNLGSLVSYQEDDKLVIDSLRVSSKYDFTPSQLEMVILHEMIHLYQICVLREPIHDDLFKLFVDRSIVLGCNTFVEYDIEKWGIIKSKKLKFCTIGIKEIDNNKVLVYKINPKNKGKYDKAYSVKNHYAQSYPIRKKSIWKGNKEDFEKIFLDGEYTEI